jgi:hypothetical protein
MHANDRRVDHLHGGVISARQWHLLGLAIWGAMARPAAGVRPIHHLLQPLRSLAPSWRVGPDHEHIEDTAVIHAWHSARLVGQHRLDGSPFPVGEFVAHDSVPPVRGLNHDSAVGLNMRGQGAFGRDAPVKRTYYVLTLSFVDRDPYRRSGTRLRCRAADT